MTKKITAYKGFDGNLACRGFRFEIGKTHEHEGDVIACESGFHACEHPLEVFKFYPPASSRFAQVELSGEMDQERYGSTKIAASKIEIKSEVDLGDLTQAAVKYVFDASVWLKSSSATGPRGGASATGNEGAASATGDEGAASATGPRGAAMATGNGGAASATGNGGAAMAAGRFGRVSGANGNALFLVERDDDWKIVAVWAGIVGQDGIEPDTFYTLRDGKPVKVTE